MLTFQTKGYRDSKSIIPDLSDKGAKHLFILAPDGLLFYSIAIKLELKPLAFSLSRESSK